MSDPEKSSSAWAVYDAAGKMLRITEQSPTLAPGEKSMRHNPPQKNYIPPDAKIAALTLRVEQLEKAIANLAGPRK